MRLTMMDQIETTAICNIKSGEIKRQPNRLPVRFTTQRSVAFMYLPTIFQVYEDNTLVDDAEVTVSELAIELLPLDDDNAHLTGPAQVNIWPGVIMARSVDDDEWLMNALYKLEAYKDFGKSEWSESWATSRTPATMTVLQDKLDIAQLVYMPEEICDLLTDIWRIDRSRPEMEPISKALMFVIEPVATNGPIFSVECTGYLSVNAREPEYVPEHHVYTLDRPEFHTGDTITVHVTRNNERLLSMTGEITPSTTAKITATSAEEKVI